MTVVLPAAYSVEQPDIYTQIGDFWMAEPVIEGRDSYRIRDEINLPVNKPNVQKILDRKENINR